MVTHVSKSDLPLARIFGAAVQNQIQYLTTYLGESDSVSLLKSMGFPREFEGIQIKINMIKTFILSPQGLRTNIKVIAKWQNSSLFIILLHYIR